MLANMAVSLIKHKRITTTVAKAKALKKYVEPLITKSKQDTTNSRRVVFSYLKDKYAVTELFKEVSVKVADRPGGYTRIIKTGFRACDAAPMCFIELITTSTWPKPKRRPSALVVPRRPLPLPKQKPAKPPLQKRRKLQKLQNNSATYLFPHPRSRQERGFFCLVPSLVYAFSCVFSRTYVLPLSLLVSSFSALSAAVRFSRVYSYRAHSLHFESRSHPLHSRAPFRY